MSELPADIKSIFADALEKQTPAERKAYLSMACSGDTALRQRIEALLLAYEEANDVPDTPIVSLDLPQQETLLTEGPGTVIGRYKLLERIGEGGMAVVYMAEQTEPIRRKVALKIIKLGMDTKQVIARFEAERQALAMMDHPNIAKVLDAGATDTGSPAGAGRPYFVMELVQGVSITEYCDKNNLSTKDRLALFLQVCNAVQHAHQKGIIHRDIKPSNVMVTHHDGKPVPKVIDFGIAKATNQRLTEKTLFTRYAHIIGTPAYMSPEQAELSDLDIDTRTDIYSLGVLLYELLTGTTPFSEEELRKAGYLEMQRVIREQEPVKPSTRIRTALRGASVPARRGTGILPVVFMGWKPMPHKTSCEDARPTKTIGGMNGVRCTPYQQVRGDLDWIVMKSLEKDRARRYEAAEDLALDIQRHLEHRPVLAHAPSAGYRLRKFLRRNRSQAIGVLAAVLMVSTVVTLFVWNRYRFRLAEGVAVYQMSVVSEARRLIANRDYVAARKTLRPILESRRAGGLEARTLFADLIVDGQESDETLKGAEAIMERHYRERVRYYTERIEANPKDPNNYLRRAQQYHYLHEEQNVHADMRRYATLLGQGWFPPLRLSTPETFRCVLSVPFDCQIVLSAERPVNGIPVMSVAFGQKGRWEMKLFEIPTFVVSLVGFGLFSDLAAPPAYADFTFGPATNLGPGINTVYGEGMGSVSADGLELYFTDVPWSFRPGGCGKQDLWVATRARTSDPWGAPTNLGGTVNSASSDGVPRLSRDALQMIFSSDRPGGYGSFDLWMTTRASKSAPWAAPVNLGPNINSAADEAFCCLSADGLELYFSEWRVLRPGGCGSADLWVATRPTVLESWGQAVNLGRVVNSSYYDVAPCISSDGLTLFFDSTRPGGMGHEDIMMTRRAASGTPWGPPVNLGPAVNTAAYDALPTLSTDGSLLYLMSDRPGGLGDYDLYQASIMPVVDFDGDGRVDGKEVLAMADNWGQNKAAYDIGPSALGDGVVDANDLIVLADYIGTEWVDPTLVAHWALDEGAGSVALDLVGGHDAMIVANVVWEPDGKVGGALAFDGKQNFARTTSPVLDPAKGPLSAIAWVKGGAIARVIVSQSAGADWLYLNPFGMLATDLKASGTSGTSLTSNAYLLDDQWHRVALVWDGTNRSLYVDGVEVATDTQPNLAPSSGNLQIGCGKGGGTFWSGLIDEVRIYNRAVMP